MQRADREASSLAAPGIGTARAMERHRGEADSRKQEASRCAIHLGNPAHWMGQEHAAASRHRHHQAPRFVAGPRSVKLKAKMVANMGAMKRSQHGDSDDEIGCLQCELCLGPIAILEQQTCFAFRSNSLGGGLRPVARSNTLSAFCWAHRGMRAAAPCLEAARRRRR